MAALPALLRAVTTFPPIGTAVRPALLEKNPVVSAAPRNVNEIMAKTPVPKRTFFQVLRFA